MIPPASCAEGSSYVQTAQIAATIATITARDAVDNEDSRIELDFMLTWLSLVHMPSYSSLQTVPVMFSPLIQV